jgi:CheY-like chemotaxis protein
MITLALEDEGHDVRSALGEGALEAARDWQPALILLDVTMPGTDGFEVNRRLRAGTKTAAIPIVVMSAHLDVPDLAHPLLADDQLHKPFDLAQLYAMVETWTARAAPTASPTSPALDDEILVMTTVDRRTYRTYARAAWVLESSTPALLHHLLCGVAPAFSDAATHMERSTDGRERDLLELSTTLTMAHGGLLGAGSSRVALSPEALYRHERVTQTVERARNLLAAAGLVYARAQVAIDRAQSTSDRWARSDTGG